MCQLLLCLGEAKPKIQLGAEFLCLFGFGFGFVNFLFWEESVSSDGPLLVIVSGKI